jgi:hypothetical protein
MQRLGTHLGGPEEGIYVIVVKNGEKPVEPVGFFFVLNRAQHRGYAPGK